jgi:hypothetical protein
MSAQGFPQNQIAPPGQRGRVRFSVEGLSARDELLFKSLVRLLDNRTPQQWSYSTEQPQLRVVEEDFLPQIRKNLLSEVSVDRFSVLVIGHTQQEHLHFLHLPLHANELEVMLNKLGPQLASFDAAPADPVLPDTSLGNEDAFVLLRWPPVALMGTPARIKLATLMCGKPMTGLLLQKRSGSSAQECADFMDTLLHAQLLERVGAGAPVAGVQQNASATPPQPSLAKLPTLAERTTATAANSKVSIGLLARIRNRLGLSAPTSV